MSTPEAEGDKDEGAASEPAADAATEPPAPQEAGADVDEGGDEDAGEAPAPAASAKAVARKPESGAGKPLTPGQRLAAAKAAKAAAKAAKRGRGQDVAAKKAAKKAGELAEWMRANRSRLLAGVAVAIVVIGSAVTWLVVSSKRESDAASLLAKATEKMTAQIRSDDAADLETPPEQEDPRPSFRSIKARARAALRAFRRVSSQYGGTDAAAWAALGEGRAQLELGKVREARAAFDRALRDGSDEPMIAWGALEGIAFTFEAENKPREAISRFQELSRIDDGAFKDVADYNIARMYLAQNDRVRATQTLRALLDRLRAGEAEEEPGAEPPTPKLPYIAAQAELRLMELDSSLVPRRPSGGPGGMMGGPGGGLGGPGGGANGLSQEQLQRFLETLQKQGAAGGGPGGPPGGGPPGGGPPGGGAPGGGPPGGGGE